MYFNSLWCYMIHGGCSIIFFLDYSMLITLPVIFLSLFIFMYIQKSIQLLCDYIVVCLYLCMCGLKRWCLFFSLFPQCSVYSQVSPPPDHPHSHFSAPGAPSGNGQYRYLCFFFFFFFFNNLLGWSGGSRDNTAGLFQLSQNHHQSQTGHKKKIIKRKQNTHKLINQTQDGPFSKDSHFFCFANITAALKK